MDYKDNMGDEIKNIFEDQAKNIKLSSKALDNIMASRKTSLREKISNFLNKEIEVPFFPVLIGFVLILGISIFPKDFPTSRNVEIININGSQIIITRDKEVTRKWK